MAGTKKISKLDEPLPKLTLKTMNTEGALRLAERILSDAANEYVEAYVRFLCGADTRQRLKQGEEFFRTISSTKANSIIMTLRRKAKETVENGFKREKEKTDPEKIVVKKRRCPEIDVKTAKTMHENKVPIYEIAKVMGCSRRRVAEALGRPWKCR